jgi:Mycothiol maleylpyruvate isomerase N-terminal domain
VNSDRVDTARLLDGLDGDVRRLRAVAARGFTAPVPRCPAWTVEDLVRHVANGYVNVVVRRLRAARGDTGTGPHTSEEPLAALDRCYAVPRVRVLWL